MSWTKSKRMVTIIGAIVLIVMCLLSVDLSQVPSQRDYEEVYKEVPSQRDYKEVLSLPSIPKYDIMPLAKYIKNREELQNTEWVSLLYYFLQTLNKSVSPHVNVVFGDSNHSHVLENWITAAVIKLKPPLHNVMVLSPDYSVCSLLLSRNISLTCIPVPKKSLIATYPKGKYAKWNSAMMIRRVVLRLISYWGYDVASYDSDAVLLHNPQVLYDEQPNVDVFAASSIFLPVALSRKWGFTLSGGVLMLRASPAVETLWSTISALVRHTDQGEQLTLNTAVKKMGVTWDRKTEVNKICSIKRGWKSKSVINIFVFPQYQICRSCCNSTLSHETLYIAHPQASRTWKQSRKEDTLKEMNAWFL